MFTQKLIKAIPEKKPLKSNKRFRFFSSINQKSFFSNLNDQLFPVNSLRDWVKNLFFLLEKSGERSRRVFLYVTNHRAIPNLHYDKESE